MWYGSGKRGGGVRLQYFSVSFALFFGGGILNKQIGLQHL